MSNITLVIVIVLVVALAIVIFTHLHKKHVRYTPESLRKAVDAVFEGKSQLPKEEFLAHLRHEFNCSMKEAHVLLGKAMAHGIVKKENGIVEKA